MTVLDIPIRVLSFGTYSKANKVIRGHHRPKGQGYAILSYFDFTILFRAILSVPSIRRVYTINSFNNTMLFLCIMESDFHLLSF
jgi:hypothetical protein